MTRREIAAALKISLTTVTKDVQHLREEWRETTKLDFAASIAEQYHRLNHVWREADEAWERSKDGVTTAQKGTSGAVSHEQTSLRKDAGDPAFLRTMLDATKQIALLLGLERKDPEPETRPRTFLDIVAEAERRKVDAIAAEATEIESSDSGNGNGRQHL
jgi:hypothetical protein